LFTKARGPSFCSLIVGQLVIGSHVSDGHVSALSCPRYEKTATIAGEIRLLLVDVNCICHTVLKTTEHYILLDE